MQLVIAPRRLSWEWTIVVTAAGGTVVFAAVAALIGIRPLIDNLRSLGFLTLALFAALVAWQLLCRFVRWFFLARALRVPIAPLDAVIYYGAGLGMALTPGRIGETLRLWFLQKHHGGSYRRLAALYVADRAGDASAYLAILAAAAGLRAEGALMRWGPLLVILACVTALLYPRPLLAGLAFVFRVTGRFKRPILWLRRLIRNTSTLLRPRVFLPALAIGVAGWCAAPVVLAVALSRMGVDVDPVSAAAIYAIGALTGGATMLPGGGGGTEVVIVGLLLAAKVPLDAAVSATLTVRIAFLWLPIALGFFFLPAAMARIRRVAPT